jgi:hypothetical protein
LTGHNIVDSIDLHELMAKVEKHFDGKFNGSSGGWEQREIISSFFPISAEVAQWIEQPIRNRNLIQREQTQPTYSQRIQ